MTQVTCTRRIEFDAAHRVIGHENKCKYLHGHRYIIEATFVASAQDNMHPDSTTMLDTLGRVVDFGVIKQRLGNWVDEHWDHNTILHRQDEKLGSGIAEHLQQTIFYMPDNPTAENMALYLLHEICPQLFHDYPITCQRIRLYETPNCYAEASL